MTLVKILVNFEGVPIGLEILWRYDIVHHESLCYIFTRLYRCTCYYYLNVIFIFVLCISAPDKKGYQG